MNPLLSQFLAEAADLLTQVDEGLLQLERTPGDPEMVNEVFRAAHTFKGSSGLFDFPELTKLTHAAEDLLDQVRGGALALDSGMTDDLLAAFDLIRGWLAHVTVNECLPDTAGADAANLITQPGRGRETDAQSNLERQHARARRGARGCCVQHRQQQPR